MIQSTVLNNGLRVITEHVPGVHSASIGIWVAGGSRHESFEQNGVAHFVEHMLFKGTSRRTALGIAREIDAVGGFLNAFTNREFCCFYAKVMGDKVPMALDLLADIILDSCFDPLEVEKERKVILQELHMVEDAPEDFIHDLFCQLFWKKHSLGMPTAGSAESVASLKREDLLAYRDRRFTGRNLIVCAAGAVVHERLVEDAERLLGGLVPGDVGEKLEGPTPQRRVNIEHRELEQVHFCLGTCALAQNHPERFAGFLLNAILGGGMSSRLFQVIREERGLAYSIYSYLNCNIDSGCQVVYSATSPEDSADAIRLILAEMRRLKKELIENDLLRDIREQLKGNLILSLESTDNRMSRLAKNQYYLGDQLEISAVLEQFDRVTREDIRRLAGQLYTNESLNLQFLGKLDVSGFPMFDLSLD